MSGGAQLLDRTPVVPPSDTVDGAALARLPEAIAEEVRRRPVMFIAEVAEKLETSVRSIRRQLRAGTFFIPRLATVDKRYRWSRARFYLATQDTTFESHRRSVLGPREVRKPGSLAK